MRPYRVMGGVLLLVVGTSAVLVLPADLTAPESVDIVAAAGPAAAPATRSQSSRPSPSPPPLTEDQLFQMSERKRFGLEHSPDYVRSLEGQRFPPSFFSIPLTAADLAEFDRRDRVGQSFERIQKFLRKQSPESFGGVWLDHAAGGVAVVATTDEASVPLAELHALLPDGAVLHVKTVRNSEAALLELHNKLGADRKRLDALGFDIATGGVPIMENKVTVGLRKGSPQSDVPRLLERYGHHPGLSVSVLEYELVG